MPICFATEKSQLEKDLWLTLLHKFIYKIEAKIMFVKVKVMNYSIYRNYFAFA